MKQYRIQFVSGTFWEVEEVEPLPSEKTGWWRVQRLDRLVDQIDKFQSMGFWFVNLDNVEGIKES
jgi:hypothetical protein